MGRLTALKSSTVDSLHGKWKEMWEVNNECSRGDMRLKSHYLHEVWIHTLYLIVGIVKEKST